VEGSRKVVVLHDFHLLTAEAAARLLKPIEEPPPSTTFVVLADFVPPELVTIASRCVRVAFRSIPDPVLAAQLLADGVAAEAVDDIVAAAGGDLTRARILATDPDLVARRHAFASVPSRLDGTGATVVATVEDLLARIEDAAAPLAARHAAEVAELEERIERFGERGSGRKALEERHKRELRRHRTDELRSGLGVLAGAYRDVLVTGSPQHPRAVVDAVSRIHGAVEAMEHNPNETLLLQSLLWSLPVT
jgi:DNA polymerase-3 subunit delta'